MKTFRVKFNRQYEGMMEAESLEEAHELVNSSSYLYYDMNATDMGETDFEFEEVTPEPKQKYTVYASTINVYAIDVEADSPQGARDIAFNRWDDAYLTDFRIMQRETDFQVDEAVEADDQNTKDEMALEGYHRDR